MPLPRRRDVTTDQKDKLVIQREEMLARLTVLINAERQVTLESLRSRYRPVILAGSRKNGEGSFRAVGQDGSGSSRLLWWENRFMPRSGF